MVEPSLQFVQLCLQHVVEPQVEVLNLDRETRIFSSRTQMSFISNFPHICALTKPEIIFVIIRNVFHPVPLSVDSFVV